MIYLDNAATTFPKPKSVVQAVNYSFLYSANPGRSGHKLSVKASEILYECREKICELINFQNPQNVILMNSCTMALNTVIKGSLKKGDHVIISSLDHNSVLRPLIRLEEEGIITYDIAEVFEGDDDKTVDSFRKLIKSNTKLCVCTHASNVFGVKLPVSRICALCHYYNILFCLDSAQTLGVTKVDINEVGADFICAPGHKGLYGPMGTGLLVINTERFPIQLYEGGTGSSSLENNQPLSLPDRYESGTINLHGFAGLSAGIDFVKKTGIHNIEKKEMNMINYLYNELIKIRDVELYTLKPDSNMHVPILSFNVKDYDCDTLATLLDKKFGIALRAGMHCSPLAHNLHKTKGKGTLRVSPSVFTDYISINSLIKAVFYVTNNKKIVF